MTVTRRLAAILAADVAGYSRLMRDDEEGTHRQYSAHLRELFRPKIREHDGRMVKSTGDGLLAEFPSVVGAVLCAIEVQCGMRLRNAVTDDQKRLIFRIGINLSDVIAEPSDIFGDGVNIAARLEALAEPGGLCISHVVHEQVRDKLSYAFEDLGPQSVKNIERPVHVYALGSAAIAALSDADAPVSRVSRNEILPALPQLRPPPLSIVVLPFANLSDDREQQYLADAMTDDVTTDLSRINGMAVISRNTAFTYKDKPVDTRQIGRELNVRYLLGGTLRRVGNQLRVNTQLVDTETDRHVWAGRFDHDNDNSLHVQDEVTSRIAVALNLEMIGAEAARPSEDPDAFDCVLRGRAAAYNYRGFSRENFAEAIGWFERALAIDPSSIEARAWLALTLTDIVLEQIAETPTADIARAEALIDEVASSPGHRNVSFVRGQILRARHQFDLAIPEYEATIALDRNWVGAIAALGWCQFFTGAIEEAIPAQEQAIRLSPRDPRLPNWLWRIGMVHLLESRVDEAVNWLQRARNGNIRFAGPHAWLAAAYALQGNAPRAAAELAEAQRLSGRYASIAAHKAAQPFSAPLLAALAEETFFAGLRKAGLSEG